MNISSLTISHLRNLSNVEIETTRRVNIVYGQNGSGKTSVLEAIYCLGYGRSFRTHQARQVIQANADAFTIFARLNNEESQETRVGFQRTRQGESDTRINGLRGLKFSELARYVPVQLITPEGVELITDGPKARRQFMDWGLFHVEQSEYQHWLAYSRLLKQRNALLRSGRFMQDGGAFWDKQLVAAGEALTRAREAYLAALNEHITEYCQRFLPDMSFAFKLMPGWSERFESFEEALAERLELDLRQGFTSVGPSKAEWQIRVDGADARERLSRGQLKLLMAALRFVQGEHYRQVTGTSCIYLIDDLPAELDVDNQQKLCQAIVDTQSQVFVTAIDKKTILGHFAETETRLFHVEQGTILDTTTG
ncbi:DNA replication/repair protein RecF [Aliidiomarina taiwanensis]|uniref:DNA replication and repair protein RecF n=1 Tax=Aliidiomarina taiwanensis TaxID=946228 RepID=A0A432X8D9_9GAMM|nr:DNA replication/repair protein RecF [Aliidiomarina taiwanensis]RUO43685.1 DNA replication/repair protein RecF [Aliidiomarina taiwanensis]